MNSLRVSPAARSYTLGHELGHLVTRVDAACIEGTTDSPFGAPVERWCEAFAATLLMPELEFRAVLRGRGVRGATAGIEDVRAAVRAFRVSGRAAALRMIDLGLAERRLYRIVEAEFRPATQSQSDRQVFSPPRAVKRLRQYGPRALDTILRDVDPFEALSILRMTVPDARELSEQVPSAAIL
jgi:Zn-dependent peptidase ImmA (M78 family)